MSIFFRLILGLCWILLCDHVFAGTQSTTTDTTVPSPNNNFYLLSTISDSNERVYFCSKKTGKKTLIHEQEVWNNHRCKIAWHSNDLAEVDSVYGNPGICSIFYSVKNNITTDCYDFPVALNKNNNLLLTAGNEVCIINIFKPTKRYCINLDFYDSIAKWLMIDKKATKFDRDGNLFLKYQSTTNEWKEKLIHFDEFKTLVK